MATQILAAGSTALSSTDIVIADGSSATIALKAAALDAAVVVELKDDEGAYVIVGRLSSSEPNKVIAGGGTYRIRRLAGGSCGVFRG